ncbi:LuxR C-terminal-related transcriptional regulator [Rufibacter sediminis]|uniref:PAS domain-containing protein n=1 Tax=Rufibacter sediminis TaxID=2762756 RepID=A0ABR6VNN7_9BACT|nr:LuxR C-terminal-related transcriptional regulator [Rufibacter sediminis]MBC3538479.1 PAS domain-containing protein [Rufibacter sediminis]
MDLLAYESAKKIWRQITKESTVPELEFELEVHKKLLNIFQVGDYYYYIFNCLEAQIEYVHENVTSVLGYRPEDFTVANVLARMHPEDLPWFLNFENAVTEFFTQLPPDKILKYKVRYDYRLRKADGEYLRILQQVVTIQADGAGGVLRTLGVHTDISHLKPEGKPVLSFIGLDGEPSYIDVNVKSIFTSEKGILSKREKEILSLLIEGNHSSQIGEKLYISQHTVNTHRKNMLAKTGAASTSELVAKAVREGWL